MVAGENSEFLVIGELTNLILVIGELRRVYTPPPMYGISYEGGILSLISVYITKHFTFKRSRYC